MGVVGGRKTTRESKMTEKGTKYEGRNGIGNTTKPYNTREEALTAIIKKTKREMGRMKANGPMPQVWTIRVRIGG